MRITETCAKCLYRQQVSLTDNQEYLAEIRKLLENRAESDTSPYMVYKFNTVYERFFGKRASYSDLNKKYNDIVLSLEASIKEEIESSKDPLSTAFLFARTGNYIDFGAMEVFDEEVFRKLFNEKELSENDRVTYESFVSQCENAKSFLLIADNCGEIVLDKLFLEQMKKRFPNLSIAVLVRGAEVLNDATADDARYVGMDEHASVYTNGMPVAGTIYGLLPDDVKALVSGADVILSKGQGNYESMCGQGMHVFYSFLCKCDLFTDRFHVPRLTGMFIEEK